MFGKLEVKEALQGLDLWKEICISCAHINLVTAAPTLCRKIAYLWLICVKSDAFLLLFFFSSFVTNFCDICVWSWVLKIRWVQFFLVAFVCKFGPYFPKRGLDFLKGKRGRWSDNVERVWVLWFIKVEPLMCVSFWVLWFMFIGFFRDASWYNDSILLCCQWLEF